MDKRRDEKMSTVDGRKKHVTFDFTNLDDEDLRECAMDGHLKALYKSKNRVSDSSVTASKPKFRTPLQEIIRGGSQE